MCDNAIDIDLSEKLQSRLEKLEELTEFTENCQKKLDGLFAAFGWSPNTDGSIAQLEPTTVCPYDFHHIIPKQSLEKHVAFCRLNKLGYSKEEQAEMYDPSVFYEKANIPTMTIDRSLQSQIILQAKASEDGKNNQSEYSSAPVEVPENHKRAICDLTVADRLAIYNHVIAETSRQKSKTESAENDDLYVDLADKLKRDEDLNCPKSHLEVLAEMRDYKRRRQSYRAKNVHITKKSYTEVIREVIDVHSGELARLWQLEDETPTRHKDTAGKAACLALQHHRDENQMTGGQPQWSPIGRMGARKMQSVHGTDGREAGIGIPGGRGNHVLLMKDIGTTKEENKCYLCCKIVC
ncbi:U11/U12 small nuclear ribonucleoprotein 48 kDa protein isoform X2 [Huso huso]|uniref:U11/U12 small nuclear ribonucleoprotein 48 kDa protein isoform X2 n=1 Tax=Huso huso TaxID=61971 RepID=A0ABR1A1F0_HUSHU